MVHFQKGILELQHGRHNSVKNSEKKKKNCLMSWLNFLNIPAFWIGWFYIYYIVGSRVLSSTATWCCNTGSSMHNPGTSGKYASPIETYRCNLFFNKCITESHSTTIILYLHWFSLYNALSTGDLICPYLSLHHNHSQRYICIVYKLKFRISIPQT